MTLIDVAALLGAASPEQVGRIGGAVFAALLLFAGIVKCLQIMRRPSTSTLCVLSLALPLVVMLAASILSVFVRPAAQDGHSYAAVVLQMFTGVRFALLFTAIVIAVIGLIQYGRNKERYTQGRHQAVWAILLATSLLTFLVYSTVSEVRARQASPVPTLPRTGEFVKFEEMNFRIRAPQKPWVQFDVKKMNADATVGFLQPKEQIGFLIVAEQAGIDMGLDADIVAVVAEAALRQAATRVDIGTKEPVTVGER